MPIVTTEYTSWGEYPKSKQPRKNQGEAVVYGKYNIPS